MRKIDKAECDAYFEPDAQAESDSPKWDPWYRGDAIDIRHSAEGKGEIIGRADDSHARIDKDHLHYVNHSDGTRTVH